MTRRILAGAAVGGILILLLGNCVLADTPDPDEAPSLHDMRVYHNLLEEDDFLAVIPYEVPYATPPELSIDKTFIFRLLDTDETTELGNILAYPYYNSGYGEGVISFYFAADDNMTWAQEYPVTITENPAAFEDPKEWKFVIGTSDYSSFDSQEENQQLLKDRVIALADSLSVIWPVTLTEESDAGTVLSAYGEAYFRNAIRGIQTMCPELFYVQISNVDMTPRTWDYSFAQTLMNTFQGTWVWGAMTGFSGLWGLETSTAMGFFCIALAVAIMSFIAYKFKQGAPGFLFLCATLVYGSLNGWFSPVLHALIAFMFVFVGGMVLFLNRA